MGNSFFAGATKNKLLEIPASGKIQLYESSVNDTKIANASSCLILCYRASGQLECIVLQDHSIWITSVSSIYSQWKALCFQYRRQCCSQQKSSSLLVCLHLKWQISRYLWVRKREQLLLNGKDEEIDLYIPCLSLPFLS